MCRVVLDTGTFRLARRSASWVCLLRHDKVRLVPNLGVLSFGRWFVPASWASLFWQVFPAQQIVCFGKGFRLAKLRVSLPLVGCY